MPVLYAAQLPHTTELTVSHLIDPCEPTSISAYGTCADLSLFLLPLPMFLDPLRPVLRPVLRLSTLRKASYTQGRLTSSGGL